MKTLHTQLKNLTGAPSAGIVSPHSPRTAPSSAFRCHQGRSLRPFQHFSISRLEDICALIKSSRRPRSRRRLFIAFASFAASALRPGRLRDIIFLSLNQAPLQLTSKATRALVCTTPFSTSHCSITRHSRALFLMSSSASISTKPSPASPVPVAHSTPPA